MDLLELPEGNFQRHPWETARAKFFCDLLRRRGLMNGSRRVLDIGAGDGYFAGCLAAAMDPGSTVVCSDLNYTDQHLRRFSSTAAPGVSFVKQPPPGPFDLLVFLDVIEHVPDDRELLTASAARYLGPGGAILVSVPAYSLLYTRHDQYVGHYRRYRPAGLRRVVGDCGFQLVAAGGLFHSLLLPRAAQKLGELAGGKRYRPDPERFGSGEQTGPGHWHGGRALTATMDALLAADNRLTALLASRGLGLPGLSTWALCRT
jgi:SAM-dependent methyltransferase